MTRRGSVRWSTAGWTVLASAVGACGTEPGARGERVLVGSGFTDRVHVLDAASGAPLDTVALDPRREERDEPHGLAVSPDGRHWYVTLAHGEATLWKLDATSHRSVGAVRLGTTGAARIGITPDGRRAFVPDYWRPGTGEPGQVAVVDLESMTVVRAPRPCAAPHDAAVQASGQLVAVTCSEGDQIVLLDAVTGSERGRFTVGPAPGPAGRPRYKPLNAVWLPGDSALAVTLHLAGRLDVYAAGGRLLHSLPTGDGPAQVALSTDGSALVVANRRGGSLTVFETLDFRERFRVPVDVPHPHGVAVSGDGSTAYVTSEGEVGAPGGVAAVRLSDGAILWQRPLGSYTLGVAVLPEG